MRPTSAERTAVHEPLSPVFRDWYFRPLIEGRDSESFDHREPAHTIGIEAGIAERNGTAEGVRDD